MNISVGVATTGGRVIDFEITNTGFGYKNNQVLTVPTFATAPGTDQCTTPSCPAQTEKGNKTK